MPTYSYGSRLSLWIVTEGYSARIRVANIIGRRTSREVDSFDVEGGVNCAGLSLVVVIEPFGKEIDGSAFVTVSHADPLQFFYSALFSLGAFSSFDDPLVLQAQKDILLAGGDAQQAIVGIDELDMLEPLDL